MKLYNLIYEDKYFVSCIAPSKLPEENFCYVEIIFDEKRGIISSVTGILQEEKNENEEVNKKESVLSDLDVSKYVEKLKEFLKREDVDKDKIHLNFVENIENEDERILKIFILLISSYLIYFNFMQFPYVISLDLLNNDKFQYFTAFSSTNQIEELFILQVSLLHRFYSEIFNERKDESLNLIEEIKEYKRRLLADIDKKIGAFEKRFEKNFEEFEETKKKLSSIFKDF